MIQAKGTGISIPNKYQMTSTVQHSVFNRVDPQNIWNNLVKPYLQDQGLFNKEFFDEINLMFWGYIKDDGWLIHENCQKVLKYLDVRIKITSIAYIEEIE